MSNNNTVSSTLTFTERLFKKCALLLSFFILGIGLSVLVGWMFDIALLTSILPSLIPMNPLVAVGFIIAAVAIIFMYDEETSPLTQSVVLVCSFIVLLIGLFRLMDILFGIDLHLDEILFKDKLYSTIIFSNVRLVPTAAFNFILIGLTLLFLSRNQLYYLQHILILVVVIISLLSLVGYFYTADNLIDFLNYTPMSLNTTVAFLLLGLAVVFIRPNKGFVEVITSPSSGGIITRRLLPFVITLPVLLGWLKKYFVNIGIFTDDLSLTVLIVVLIIIFFGLVYWVADFIHQIDILRIGTESELEVSKKQVQEVNEKLDTQISELENQNKELESTKRAMLNIMEDLQVEKTKVEKEKVQDEAILGSIGDGVVATDKDAHIILMNNPAKDMLGRENEQVIGKVYFDIVLAQDNKGKPIEKEDRAIWKALSSKQATSGTYYYVRKDGTAFPAAVTASPVILYGEVVGSIVVFRDVTKEKEIDRMKTEFISLASHQLRTPLSAMKWFLEMLLNGDAGPLTLEQMEYIRNIDTSNERMIELVNSLLNISRIESGRIIIDPKLTDLGELVKQVITEVEVKQRQKNQTLVVSVHPNLPKINIDPKLIREVYANMLTNAIKYTPEGGEISVFISRKDDEIISQISDTGYGIPEKEQKKLFEKFYRADNIRKVEPSGTGLGLYLAKAIIESSLGKVWFKSEEGKGTTFWFSLPVAGTPAKEGEVYLDS
jgi:PAS domain S-box-containing protein